MRITTLANGKHHEVIPVRSPIGTKTLSSIRQRVVDRSEFPVADTWPYISD